MNNTQKDIITILKGYLHKDYDFVVESSIEDICNLANYYTITPVISYTLSKNKKYKNYVNDEQLFVNISRVEAQNSLREEVIDAFDHNGIGYVFIKGKTLSKYYDEEFLRYSSDVDVVVKNEDYERAIDILVKEKGFRKNKEIEYEISLSNKNCMSLDLHHMFGKYNDNVEALYKEVDFYSKCHELDNEFKLLHLCSHGAKHIASGFIAMQFLLDLYYLNSLSINKDKVDALLKEANLYTFYEKTTELVNVLFNDNKETEVSKQYIELLFNSKKSKGRENMVRISRGKNGTNKFVYVLSRLFPNYAHMAKAYPILKTKKYLMPLYYFVRVFQIVFTKNRFVMAKQEIDYCIKDNDENIDKTKKLFNDLGI